MCKRYNMHANKVKKYVLSNYPASAAHLKTVGGLTHSMCLILWGLQGIYTRLLLIMKLISVYLEYIVVSEYTQEKKSLVKRNHLNFIHEKEQKSLVSGKKAKGIIQTSISSSLKQIEWELGTFARMFLPLPSGLKMCCFISQLVFFSEQNTMLDWMWEQWMWKWRCGYFLVLFL